MVVTYNLPGNAFFLAAFGILLPSQMFLGIKYKTWGFLFGTFCGLVLEIIGYVARIQLHFKEDAFTMYIVCLTIGPAFLSAAIYLCLARLIVVFGEQLSRFRPRTITIAFMLLDFGALLLQAGGGALTTSDDMDVFNTGLDVLKAGLSVHLVAIVVYVALSCDFAFSVYKNRSRWNSAFEHLQRSRRFLVFIAALALATLCILIRTVYRVAELSQGFDSSIANNEAAFFGLEGIMVLLASLCLTLFHPGPAFQRRWGEADFHLKSSKDSEKGEVGERIDS